MHIHTFYGTGSNIELVLKAHNNVVYVDMIQYGSVKDENRLNIDRLRCIYDFCIQYHHNRFLFKSSTKNNKLYKPLINVKGSDIKLIPIIDMDKDT